MALEFELPLISLLLMIIINAAYFARPRVKIAENIFFNIILVCSLIESLMNTILHFIFAVNNYNTLVTKYYDLFNWSNRIITILFVTISVSLLCYILSISSKKIKNDNKKLHIIMSIIVFVFAICICFTNIELVKIGTVTNVRGSTILVTYIVIAIMLALSMLVTLTKIKKLDNRYATIFAILIYLIFFYEITIYFPGMIIHDAVITLMCYVMYFTIENPDVKMLNKVELAKIEAEQASKAKTDFLSSMSHEIRTPLNAIVGFSDCITKADNLESVKEDARDIVTASKNLLEIVNGVLDISKIESGKMEVVETNYDLKRMGNDLVKLTMIRIGEKPITIRTNFSGNIPEILYGDAGKMKQIMINVLTNAVKYTEKGSIDFNINCVNDNSSCKLIISIEDTGRGIKPENMGALFNKFERLEEDKNTTIEGTGLGLAITKSLVEMMGGRIIAQSKYGEGTKFTIYLCQGIGNKQAYDLDRKSTSNKKDFSGKRILNVDDNKLNLKIATRLLSEYNVVIDEVDSGFACLDRIDRGDVYDLILLDDMMPKMTGTSTLHKLKERLDFDTPVVVLTANAIDGMKEKYLNEGFTDYLAKPIDKVELERILNTYLTNGKVSGGFFEPLPKSIYTITDEDVKEIDELIPISSESNNESLDVKEEVVVKEEPASKDTEEEVPVKEETTSNKNSKEFLVENEINVDAGLELLGDIEMYNETLSGFIKENDNRIPKMEEYMNSSNMKDYAILAHAMKSDSKYLGFTKLAELALEHELKGKANDADYVKNNYQVLMDEVNRVTNVVKEYLG